ncbi:probable inactive receptor kinase At2g26730 [Cryptomeria japonica]|uniref:probable inactive receptor kinase At2g26730 n=1 Tax=Cryptomeria japonica TaxID=3369 RepID=UPI0027DA0ABE|nr:probable inactive receptor kinase At2g26730 [Cryptomeria japonica]
MYNKKQVGQKNHLKESEIPNYFSSGLKNGNPGDWNKASESMEPDSLSINSEEEFSSDNHSTEFEPPKLEFIEKEHSSPFVMEELLRASVELLGEGASGEVYRVMMDNGVALVVKRLKDLQVEGKEFENRMEFMGNLKHSNVLPIFAYCFSPDENLVIYQYQNEGSLASLLHEFFKGQRELKWDTRLSIIRGVASGLAFMHREFESQGSIPHGNLKPSNVILRENLEPYIADYGFNSLVEADTIPTPFPSDAYKAPERKITQKTDVYSFGFMLLELLTGKRADNGGFNLPNWVQSVVREEWAVNVFDKEMVRNAGEDRIVQLLQLGLNCVNMVPEIRPTMSYACDVIDELWDHEEESNNSFESSQSSFHSTHFTTELPGGGISMATPSPIRNQSIMI